MTAAAAITVGGRRVLGQGCECKVYDFSPRKVLKLYRSKSEAREAFEAQKAVHAAGYAPKAYEVVELKGRPLFTERWHHQRDAYPLVSGYVSQKARPLVQAVGWGRADEFVEQMENIVDFVEDRTGVFMGNDIHTGNLGMIARRCVFIDFGECSL